VPRDYYELLGVDRGAGDAEIKRSFRRLARELHPDVNTADPEAEHRFKEVAEAYEVLSDSDKRATYDRYGHDGLRAGGYAPSFDTFGSFGDIFDAFFGGGAGGGIFGGGGGGRGGAVQGGDVAAQVEIGLAEAARGTSVEVTFDAVERCPTCRGNGAQPGTPLETCPRCDGAGQLRAVSRTPFGQVVRATACPECDGDGRRPRQPGDTCRGRGRTVADRSVRVDVPAGIDDGQRIRVTGRGHAGDRGGPPGDLYVLVRVADDARFVRDGDDLVCVLDVPAPLAALGTTLEAPTLDGPVEVDVAAGTQAGETLVLRGKGMPALRGRRRGNLRVVVNVVTPRRLSRRQRELLEELADTLKPENVATEEGVLGKLRRVLGAR
jgi:molecular chaperone DnaJ